MCFIEEDEELKRIRTRKLKKLMEKTHEKSKKKNTLINKPIEINDATFNNIIQDYPLVVVDCWAPWCAPCLMVAPIIEEMARDYSGKIFFGKLNVDENRMVTNKYNILSIPTLLVFKKGKCVDQIIGAMPKKILIQKIIPYL